MLLPLFLVSELASAAEVNNLGLTGTETGIFTVLLFIIAYGFVMAEEFTHLRKSKPVIFAGAVIWA
ncbi:MAG TPA: sodium:proton antiporter, partial [Methylococcales bacterium]|nr:sodium:proton antiporter [Methylococcales bacterium]